MGLSFLQSSSILKIEARREWRNLLSFSLKKLKNLHPRNFFSVFHGITISQKKKEKLPSPLLLFRPLYLCSLLKKYITEVHMTKTNILFMYFKVKQEFRELRLNII